MTDPTTHQPVAVIPEMVMKRDTIFMHPEDIERVLMDKLPGYIPDVSGGAQMPGCRLLCFKHTGLISGMPDELDEDFWKRVNGKLLESPAEMINTFFQFYANYILVKMFPDGVGNVYVEYTSMLNNEDTADLQEISAEQRKAMNTKRAERKAAAEAVAAGKKAENDALMIIAKDVQTAGGIAERIAELVDTVNTLTAENKKLARKVRK